MSKSEMYGLINSGSWKGSNKFVTADNTATPETSPVSVASGSITTLTVPDKAVELTIYSSANLRISEVAAMGQYFVIPYGTVVTVNVAAMSYVYLKGDSSACTVQFMFSDL